MLLRCDVPRHAASRQRCSKVCVKSASTRLSNLILIRVVALDSGRGSPHVNVTNIYMGGLIMHHHVLLWPLGLMLLGFLIGSGRMACWAQGNGNRWQRRMERMQRRVERMQAAGSVPWGRCGGYGYRASSGNRAFDEYRTDTLRRLKKSSANSWSSSTVCGMPRTRPNSTNLWQSAVVARKTTGRSRKPSDQLNRPISVYRSLLGGVSGLGGGGRSNSNRTMPAAITQAMIQNPSI